MHTGKQNGFHTCPLSGLLCPGRKFILLKRRLLMWHVCRQGWGGLLFLFQYLMLSNPSPFSFGVERLEVRDRGSFWGSHYQVAPNSLPIALRFMTLGILLTFPDMSAILSRIIVHILYGVYSLTAIKTVCHITKPLCIPNLKYSLKSLCPLYLFKNE